MKAKWLVILATGGVLSFGGLVQAKPESHKLSPPSQENLVVGQVLDRATYESSPVQSRSDGLVTIKLDGKLLKLDEATLEIIDVVTSAPPQARHPH